MPELMRGRRGDGSELKRLRDDGECSKPRKQRKIRDEADVGITQMLCPDVPRFRGILKSKLEDFIVHEIAPDRTVIHLTNLSVDDTIKREAAGLEQLRELSSASDHEGFTAFYELVQRYQIYRTEESRKRIPPDEFLYRQQHEKAVRLRFRDIIKEHFRELVLDTIVKANEQGAQTCYMRVKHAAPKKQPKQRWPKGRPEYLHFTLFKTNVDNQAALSLLANRASVPQKEFNIAEPKEKTGVTCLRVSVRKVLAENLVQKQGELPSTVKVGNFAYQTDQLKLGSLFGNHFTVAVRELQGLNEAGVQAALQSLKQSGFINYSVVPSVPRLFTVLCLFSHPSGPPFVLRLSD